MRVADELLSNYQHLIDDLTLVTGAQGIFDIAVDDTLIYSKASTGRFPHEGEALAELEKLLPDGATRYGS